jgi:O-succinylbenzoic acid--CoA ligase
MAARGAAVRHAGTREAVLVELRDDAGSVVGVGEAAPLPGMSRDTIDDVLEELAARAARDDLGDAHVRSPALRFALEAARGGGTAGAPIAAAVVVDDAHDAADAVARGVAVLKIKVGRADDVARVAAIAAAAPGARLRLDANRAWTIGEAPARLAELAAVTDRIAFVEEPCRDAVALLDQPLAARLALDESLGELEDAALARALASPRLAALVLKPTLLGPARCRELARRARAHGVAAIVSHTLEGPIGHAACVALARELAGDDPHGVGEHPALAGWAPLPAGAELAAVVAAAPPDPALSVGAAALDRPDALAIATPTTELSFRDCAAHASRRVPRAIVATATVDTLHAIHAALDRGEPLGLVHARLAPAERDRQLALVDAAQLERDAAFVLFTSGSTGSPRGVVLTRAGIAAACDASAARLGWRADDRWLLALSLAHTGGLAVAVRCLVARAPVVLLDGDTFDAPRCAALLADRRVTLASLVPTQLAALLDDPAWRPPARLRAVLLGGAASPPALVDAALARGVPALLTYGMTESFGQVATATAPGAPPVRLPAIALASDAAGRIVVRGPTLAARYLDGSAIAPAFTTADLGAIAADGTVSIAGRRDDVIITGGENVHPAEVEAVLAATPGVRAAVAFGVPDDRWGQLVGAAIAIDRATFDRAAAAARWRAALPAHARPRRVALVDALPQLPTGKLDRRAAAALPHDVWS